MNKECFYDVFLNDKRIATVGPGSLKQLHISFGITEGEPLVKASGISDKEPGLLYIEWLNELVTFDDSLRISPSKENDISNPQLTKKLKRGIESNEEDRYCEFCKGSEQEVGVLLTIGDSPNICRKCVEHCADEFENMDQV
jgi:hypothetical protein